jgi:hypothetical protein
MVKITASYVKITLKLGYIHTIDNKNTYLIK